MADQFNYNYNPLQYADAQKQIAQQVDPLYNRAIQNVNQQKYQSDVQAGQVAAARGLGHSGLAADQLNKIAIASQGQIGDISAQRATQIAQLASGLMERDKDRGMQARSQAYQEWMGQQNLQRDDRNFDYQKGRDAIYDTRYNNEWNYQLGRDKISDQRYSNEWNNTLAQQKLEEAWRQKEWNNMSPAEKQRAQLEYEYAKKKASLGKSSGGGGSSSSKSSSASQSYQAAKTSAAKTPADKYYETQENIFKGSVVRKNPVITPPSIGTNPNLSNYDRFKMIQGHYGIR